MILNLNLFNYDLYAIISNSLFFFREHYFTAVTWANPRQVAVVWMNRRQNLSIISVCTEPDWQCEDVSLDFSIG
jgi:Dipeptidyl peptidase IV (DPP IV) N-terminal region